MVVDIRDIAQERNKRFEEKEDRPPRFRAVIIEQRNSSGEDSVYVERREVTHVWVRLWAANGNVLPAYNAAGVPQIDGMPVFVTRKRGIAGELEIDGIDKETLEQTESWDVIPSIVRHAITHEWPDGSPGWDAVSFYPRSFVNLRTYETNPASLGVNVSRLRHIYDNTDQFFDGAVIDLTASVPAGAGQARLVLVYLDPSTNTLGSANGAIGLAVAAWFLDEPVYPDEIYPSAVVRLENGQTDITEEDIRDRRMFLSPTGYANLDWPSNDRILLMTAAGANVFYDTFAEAIAVAVADDVIYVPSGVWVCNGLTTPDDVNVIGMDRDSTILRTTTNSLVLRLGENTYLYNIQIQNIQASAGAIEGVRAPGGGSATLHDCKIVVNNTQNSVGSHAYGTTSGNDLILIETDIITSVTNAAASSTAMRIFNDYIVRGGRVDTGVTGVRTDILVINPGSVADVEGTIFVNYAFGGDGLIKGIRHDHSLDSLTDVAHLGDLMFDDADGLLLLDFQRYVLRGSGAGRANYFQGTRLSECMIGAAAADPADRGAVHFEAGRWPNKRAYVPEIAETNDAENPLMYDGNSDGTADDWTAWDNVVGAPTYTVVDHPDDIRKGWLQRVQYVGVPGDAGQTLFIRHSTAAASYAPGEDCTFSAEYRGAVSGCAVILRIIAEDNVNANLGFVSLALTFRPNIQHARLTYLNLPANTDHVRVQLYFAANIDNGDTLDVYFGAVNVEKNDHGTTLIAGNFGEGYSWSGVAHASTSDRTRSYADLDDYVALVSDNNTSFHRVVIRAPYDYDAVWPSAGAANSVWIYRGADTFNQVFLTFDATDNRFEVFINNAYRLFGTGFTFSKGDWLDIVVNLDFTGDLYELYINGERLDVATTTLTAPTGVVSWKVGSYHDGIAQGGFWFAEYAVGNRVLTAMEIGNLYANQRPLVDFFALENRPVVPTPNLAYGEIWAHDVAHDVNSVAVDTWYQITGFDTNGLDNRTTPDQANDHIVISVSGVYKVQFTWNGHTHANPHDWMFHIVINNNGTNFMNAAGHITTPVVGRIENVSSSPAHVELSVGDTVELWFQRLSAGANIVLTTDAVSLSVDQVR